MEFTPIRPIEPLWDSLSAKPAEQAKDPARSLFAAVFQSAIDNVRETNQVQVDLEYQLATGQIDNPAELTLASSKYEMSVNLLVQLRNRAVEAYNEIMRISL